MFVNKTQVENDTQRGRDELCQGNLMRMPFSGLPLPLQVAAFAKARQVRLIFLEFPVTPSLLRGYGKCPPSLRGCAGHRLEPGFSNKSALTDKVYTNLSGSDGKRQEKLRTFFLLFNHIKSTHLLLPQAQSPSIHLQSIKQTIQCPSGFHSEFKLSVDKIVYFSTPKLIAIQKQMK